ncbi:hypothetical protein JNB63_14195 [Microbacterium trichothecenolyticum]|uniref:hypothetical protein n=1 Tax=Microbacterium trichothecenolyticum TaxID=69370 RepID=UPI001C6EAECD|nr:hypothetical protein [Microbacterium trichothecenolyticum]MBW9121246.1 hypothetical protein [Microbacterium trichothecenolyticum]
MKRHILALGLAATLVLGGATAASAEETPNVHPDVAYALANEPGGVAVDYYTAEWPALAMRLQVSSGVNTRSVGSCAAGAICAYSGGGMGGTKLSWTTCGTKSTAALSTVGSIANARTSGTLSALAAGIIRVSVGAGSYVNVPIAVRSLITAVSC